MDSGIVMHFISDTHGLHDNLSLSGGDILFHCGDIEARTSGGLIKFLDWFSQQDYKHKVFIPGNHDFYLRHGVGDDWLPDNCYFLSDEFLEIDGVGIYGTPWSLNFGNWAFMGSEGELDSIYSRIPENTDVLLSHGPPNNILDKTVGGVNAGSKSLLRHIQRVDPSIIAFGHIHEGYGEDGKYINCSVLNEKYQLTNKPVGRLWLGKSSTRV